MLLGLRSDRLHHVLLAVGVGEDLRGGRGGRLDRRWRRAAAGAMTGCALRRW